jgi:hypothetical protein
MFHTYAASYPLATFQTSVVNVEYITISAVVLPVMLAELPEPIPLARPEVTVSHTVAVALAFVPSNPPRDPPTFSVTVRDDPPVADAEDATDPVE